MKEDLREEVEWLEHRIKTLEEYIEKLEHENFQLKKVIGKTINTLEKQNADTRKVVYGKVLGRSVNKDGKGFVPLLKTIEEQEED